MPPCNCSACLAVRKAIESGALPRPIHGCCACPTRCSIRTNENFTPALFALVSKTGQRANRTRRRNLDQRPAMRRFKTLHDLSQLGSAECDTCMVEQRWYGAPEYQTHTKIL
jgi:hypothetical protein